MELTLSYSVNGWQFATYITDCSEGALGYWALTPNIDLWGMCVHEYFYGPIQQPVFVMKVFKQPDGKIR